MNITEINPLALPSLPLVERSQLPNLPAIYFALDGDCILYIGKTSNLVQRWVNHHRCNQLIKISNNVRVAWIECSDSNLLPKIETALIKHFQPTLNHAPGGGGKVNIYFNDEEELQLYESIVMLAKKREALNQPADKGFAC